MRNHNQQWNFEHSRAIRLAVTIETEGETCEVTLWKLASDPREFGDVIAQISRYRKSEGRASDTGRFETVPYGLFRDGRRLEIEITRGSVFTLGLEWWDETPVVVKHDGWARVS